MIGGSQWFPNNPGWRISRPTPFGSGCCTARSRPRTSHTENTPTRLYAGLTVHVYVCVLVSSCQSTAAIA
jgi:hypothetical protein